jgi:hypothetical protein
MNQFKDITPQLYNLAEDPGEKVNLHSENPNEAKLLLDELNRIREAFSTR